MTTLNGLTLEDFLEGRIPAKEREGIKNVGGRLKLLGEFQAAYLEQFENRKSDARKCGLDMAIQVFSDKFGKEFGEKYGLVLGAFFMDMTEDPKQRVHIEIQGQAKDNPNADIIQELQSVGLLRVFDYGEGRRHSIVPTDELLRLMSSIGFRDYDPMKLWNALCDEMGLKKNNEFRKRFDGEKVLPKRSDDALFAEFFLGDNLDNKYT